MTAQPGLSDRALAAIASARRAAAAYRGSHRDTAVEVRPLTSLAGDVEAWKLLAARAIEPNVFLEPPFALAATPALGADVEVGLVWSQSAPRELIGLFPVRVESRRYGLPMPVLTSWTHPFAPFGTPLVHRAAAEPAVAAWLDHILHDASLPGLLLLPYIHDDGPFASVLDGVLARRQLPAASYDRHQRALFAPMEDRTGYLVRAMTTKHRRELARQWRRMRDIGPVAVTAARDVAAVAQALADFLRLEAGGWKGRAGTAAASSPAIQRFVTKAVAELALQGRARIDRLCIGANPIAACIILQSGAHAWLWKIAYDEAYARFSPGAQLIAQVTDALAQDAEIVAIDSLATPNHPLIDRIWRERRTMSDRLIATRPDSLLPFSVVCRLEAMRRLGRSTVRTLREHLRGH
jgi:CelD/BcsL family acetyltransferase involved in cellulose biosynthesis